MLKIKKMISFKCPTCGSDNILFPDEDFCECKKCQEKADEMLRFEDIPFPKKYKIVPTKYYRNPLYECKDGTFLKYEDAVKSIGWFEGGYPGTTSQLIMRRKNDKITGKIVISEVNNPFIEKTCTEDKIYTYKDEQKLWNRIIQYLFYKKQVQSFQKMSFNFVTDVWGALTVKFVDGRKLYIDIQDIFCSQSSSIGNLEYYFEKIIEEKI
ncbi:MAG: hypothetical protein MJ250_08540, partial [Alphaproteobacteria bacterium]|nr:hypothetical protein [Alphaproteobacteria bacterium]